MPESTETFWRAIVDALHESVVVRDQHGTVIYINAAAEALSGLVVSDAAGRELGFYVERGKKQDGSQMTRADLPAARVLATGEPVRDELLGIETIDRGARWVLVNAAPLPLSESDTTVGVVSTALDVTDRVVAERSLHTSEERFRSVATTMFAGLAIFSARRNDAGKIIDLVCDFVNDAVAQHGE